MHAINRLSWYVIILLMVTRTSSFVLRETKDHRFDLHLSSQSNKDDHSMNEFSRTFCTETILKTSSGKRRRTREFKTTITATEEECHALEMRFDLDKLHSLKADLSISWSNVLGGSRSKGLV